ncbi:hypothetical protein [Streptomyces sp. NPDC051994]|uniref:hypothetical protein n=1 Tax=unclassified Streptomyces TaxID=2593676 RepID=UPI00341CEB2C
MTITMPWQGTGSRRAVDKLADTRRQLAAVQADNEALRARIKELRDRLDKTYTAWEAEAEMRGETEVIAGATMSQLQDAVAELVRLTTEVTALRAQVANLTSVTVPPMVRAIDPGDQATEPTGIDVRPLWEALREHGPVIPVPTPTAGTSPAHVPTWGTPDTDTVALPALRLVQGTT